MAAITRAQRMALKRVFDRGPIYAWMNEIIGHPKYNSHKPITYRQFRRRVVKSYDCIMIQWCGMWLGIETDGYTHS